MYEKLNAIASRAKTSIQYVYPSMDRIYCNESPYKLGQKSFKYSRL